MKSFMETATLNREVQERDFQEEGEGVKRGN
jgi:hypothetical protein